MQLYKDYREALRRVSEGHEVKVVLVSQDGDRTKDVLTDLSRYLEHIFKYVICIEEEEAPKPKKPKRENKPGDRPFDRLCREQERTNDFSKETIAKICEALVIYDEEEDE